MTHPLPTPQQGYGSPSAYGRAGYPAPPPPVAPNGQPLASFGDRFLAYLLDYVILSAVSAVFLVPAVIYQFSLMSDWAAEMAGKYPDPAAQRPSDEFFADYFAVFGPLMLIYLAVFIAVLLVLYVYRVELMFRTGQTIGKRVMKLRVVPLDPSARLTRGMAARRWLVDSLAAQFVPFLAFVDGLWQLWDQPYRQCLHDKVAGTTVVKVTP